jgi:POT family proton-dependent oligopeptide transporter
MAVTPVLSSDDTSVPVDRSFFGHPRGLSTLFMTEMWERFSYYGMRALLILFMTAPAARGGLGFSIPKAGAIYGFYTAMVYLMGLPGGWIADRIIGSRRAVLWGGTIIVLGHVSLAIPNLSTFYTGLLLVVLGTGLLKPNISTMVGALYPEHDVRRDAGFSIFYMGINIGALLAPLVCGYLGENINWHYGFAASGVGMTFGLIQYVLGGRYLGTAGMESRGDKADRRIFRLGLTVTGIVAGVAVAANASGIVKFSAESLSDVFGLALAGIVVVFFIWLFTAKGYSALERRHFWAILVLFIASALFWSAFEQAGSTLSLFADRNTNLHSWDVSGLWGRFHASYFQAFNSFFVIALAPLFALLWVRLGRREPSSTAKFSWGLLFVALGFAILIPVAHGKNVSPMWLTLTYLLHTVGELCLSPVGLSTMTKLAPARIAGLIMGVWFLSVSVGDYIGGRLSGLYESLPLPELFGVVVLFCVLISASLVFLRRPMRGLMGGVN